MTLPSNVKNVLNQYKKYGLTGKVELEFYGGRLEVYRPKLNIYEVERVQRSGGTLSFVPKDLVARNK